MTLIFSAKTKNALVELLFVSMLIKTCHVDFQKIVTIDCHKSDCDRTNRNKLTENCGTKNIYSMPAILIEFRSDTYSSP